MNNLFVFAAHNTVVALVFALFVYGLETGLETVSGTFSGKESRNGS
jgi:hypothetical protein